MTTSAAAAPAVRAAFAELIDYAGLFPPADLDVEPAVREYSASADGAFAWMLGRFIVQASRVPQLLAAATAPAPIRLSAIVDAGTDPRAWLARVLALLEEIARLHTDEARIRIEALEIALPPLATMRETYDAAIGQFAAALRRANLQTLPAYVELPRDERWSAQLDGALFALARHQLGAKLRCGGVLPSAFPSPDQVAEFIAAAAEHGLRMKATAGLHHPVRRPEAHIGATMHGFLNVLAAAAFARTGARRETLVEILSCEDPGAFGFDENGLAYRGEHVSAAALQATRERLFVAYGSCSFSEPTADLQELGIL